jgi:hypothetical protein
VLGNALSKQVPTDGTRGAQNRDRPSQKQALVHREDESSREEGKFGQGEQDVLDGNPAGGPEAGEDGILQDEDGPEGNDPDEQCMGPRRRRNEAATESRHQVDVGGEERDARTQGVGACHECPRSVARHGEEAVKNRTEAQLREICQEHHGGNLGGRAPDVLGGRQV